MMYAPVRRLSDVTVRNGRLAGQAHSEAGEPCAIELVSGPHVIGAVRADRPADVQTNPGWRQEGCTFGIDLRPADFVFADELALRCAVSKEILHVVHFGAVEWPAPPEITEISVADILAGDGDDKPDHRPPTEPFGADGVTAEQIMEKWRQLMFPSLAPDDFRIFIGALEPDSPERAALLALAALQRPNGKTAAHPGLEDDNGSNA